MGVADPQDLHPLDLQVYLILLLYVRLLQPLLQLRQLLPWAGEEDLLLIRGLHQQHPHHRSYPLAYIQPLLPVSKLIWLLPVQNQESVPRPHPSKVFWPVSVPTALAPKRVCHPHSQLAQHPHLITLPS